MTGALRVRTGRASEESGPDKCRAGHRSAETIQGLVMTDPRRRPTVHAIARRATRIEGAIPLR